MDFTEWWNENQYEWVSRDDMARAAWLAGADSEREQCAKMCDDAANNTGAYTLCYLKDACDSIAKMLRSKD